MQCDLSITIITYNEEKNLGRCLKSLPAGAELIVVDSQSTDRTVALAQTFGAKVYQRPFDDYAAQKNAAISWATRTWVLSLDADEELSPELRDSLSQVSRLPLTSDSPHAYRLNRQLHFLGRPLRFGKSSDRPLRFFRRAQAHFEHGIHERLTVAGTLAPRPLAGVLHHHSYADLSYYFVRFNHYTSQVAAAHFKQGKRGQTPSWTLRHTLRPGFEFFNRYILRLGFLDGYPGYCYALLSSLYAFVKYAKLRELTLAELHAPDAARRPCDADQA